MEFQPDVDTSTLRRAPSMRPCRFTGRIGNFAVAAWLLLTLACHAKEESEAMSSSGAIPLPAVEPTVNCDLNRALRERRSIREYSDHPLNLKQLSELLWAAQGITSLGGFRTAPSAGATYPLEVWVAAGNVEGLEKGLYRYDPREHVLRLVRKGDFRKGLAAASLGQMWMSAAPAMVIFTAVPTRTTRRYGERGMRYIYNEVGHASQNLSLAAAALQLGTVVVAAFDDDEVAKLMELPRGEIPLYIMPVGHK